MEGTGGASAPVQLELRVKTLQPATYEVTVSSDVSASWIMHMHAVPVLCELKKENVRLSPAGVGVHAESASGKPLPSAWIPAALDLQGQSAARRAAAQGCRWAHVSMDMR